MLIYNIFYTMNNKTFLITTTLFYTEKKEIFIIKRNNEPMKWYLWLPWWKLEYMEKIDNWNIREIKEELWFEIWNVNFYKIFEFFDIWHAIVFCFIKKVDNKEKFLKNLKISQKEILGCEFMNFSEIINNKNHFFNNNFEVISNFINKINKWI